MKIDINHFEDLKEQIYNPKKWDKDRFIVFDYEAGTGKSLNAQQFIAEMAKEQLHKVLYVQRFSRDDELEQTAYTINKQAGKLVAVAYSSKDYKGEGAKQKKQRALDSQILCVTHNMYSQICKGNHQELISNRDVLIIDEYLDLLEKVTVSLHDLGVLWSAYPSDDGNSKILKVATKFKDILLSNKGQIGNMPFHSFVGSDYHCMERDISIDDKSIVDSKHKSILNNCLQLLKNGGYIYEDEFHTYNDDIDFVMLKNNIILDANAGFDYRYEMSDKFDVRKQEKMFEYTKSRVHHIDVNTTKKSLDKYIDFAEKVLETVQIEQRKGVLFVTDMANKDGLESCILNCYSNVGDTIEEIEEKLECKISVDYFGNIIGVNTYREYETVVIMKTPNYDYLTYVLTSMLYKSKDGLSVESVRPFQDDEIEMLRKTTVAGEIYQAIKRINRDNNQLADIFIYSDYQEAVDLVVQQLPNVSYTMSSMDVSNKRKETVTSSRKNNSAATEVQRLLLEMRKKGVEKIGKREIKKKFGITDTYFPKILIELKDFLTEHNIHKTRQELIFDKSA